MSCGDWGQILTLHMPELPWLRLGGGEETPALGKHQRRRIWRVAVIGHRGGRGGGGGGGRSYRNIRDIDEKEMRKKGE